MAYDQKKIFEQAKEEIKKNNLFFIEDVVSFLPCTKPTFYEFFPPNSNEFNEIKELLERNKVKTKSSMRAKWYKNDNPTLQMGLYKLICSDEERKSLSMTHTDVTSDGAAIAAPVIKIGYKTSEEE